MYYIICTIIIMVFCITALTNSNTGEREFFLPAPKSPFLQHRKTITECTIKHSAQLRFEIIKPLPGNKQSDLCVKAIPIVLLAPYLMQVQAKQNPYYIKNATPSEEKVPSSYFIEKTTPARKDIATTFDNRSCTVALIGHHYKSSAGPIFPLTLIIPVTPSFSTNNKSETVRRISTTSNQSYSLRQLRYMTSQSGTNNEWVYRRVLKLRSRHEKIQI